MKKTDCRKFKGGSSIKTRCKLEAKMAQVRRVFPESVPPSHPGRQHRFSGGQLRVGGRVLCRLLEDSALRDHARKDAHRDTGRLYGPRLREQKVLEMAEQFGRRAKNYDDDDGYTTLKITFPS